jgi:hypothetical protein
LFQRRAAKKERRETLFPNPIIRVPFTGFIFDIQEIIHTCLHAILAVWRPLVLHTHTGAFFYYRDAV